MKKVCFMMPTIFNIGGEQRVVSVLCNVLNKRGYKVSALLFDNRFEENYELYNLNKDINIKYVDGYQGFSRRLCRKVRNLNSKYGFLKKLNYINKFLVRHSFPFENVVSQLEKIKPDILIGVAGEFNLLACLLKDVFPEIKIIGWQHSSFDAYFNTKGRRHYNEKGFFVDMVKKLDKYIVLTKSDKQKMKETFNIDATCIYNIKSFNCMKKSNLLSHQFISVGRMDKVKGFDLLIEAYNEFYKNNPASDWKLVIIGDGDERECLEKLIKAYNLEKRVFLPGYSNNVIGYYLNSSIYIMSSRWEGFPMVLSECMELGLPIVSFDIDVMKEFISNGNDGILVEKGNIHDLANAMKKVSEDVRLRKFIAKNEAKKIKELSEDNILEQWEQIFKEFEGNENRKIY